MPKKHTKSQPAVHHTHKTTQKAVQIVGSLLILAIFTLPFLFYVFQGIAYLPSIQYVLVGLGCAVVVIYSYILTLTIKSQGKYVVILVNFVAAILLSVVLLAVFTPFLNFVIAKTTNNLLCARIPELDQLPPRLLVTLQELCTNASYRFIFGQN